MNMIIAGDGHTNIQAGDSLKKLSKLWSVDREEYDLVVTNPPFGTSEADTLTKEDRSQFENTTTKGQYLFLEKIIRVTKPGGDICTVIDEGLLNTETGADLRSWLMKQCEVRAIVLLPDVTFKPNKINVRSSVMLLRKRKSPDIDLEAKYTIRFLRLGSLGYQGSGEVVRGFDLEHVFSELDKWLRGTNPNQAGSNWSGFGVDATVVAGDGTTRLDLKYWDNQVRGSIQGLKTAGFPDIKSINTIPTKRGKSPPAEAYVDRNEGYALVVKAGTNISKFGELIEDGDFIEKSVFEEMKKTKLMIGDILISSTGTGTLGKCCVFRSLLPAIPDGHVTVVRVDTKKVYPEYLCDYIRLGFGAVQVQRLFTGSTGLIELTPDQVDQVVIELPGTMQEQMAISKELRSVESGYRDAMADAEQNLIATRRRLFKQDPGIIATSHTLATEALSED